MSEKDMTKGRAPEAGAGNTAGAAAVPSEETLICISCPRGCTLKAVRKEDGIEISGNYCSKGASYAAQEILEPKRVLTCLMRPAGADRPVSVRTDAPVPRDMLLECARYLYTVRPKLPVHQGDVLVQDLCGTGVNVIATRDAEAIR